MNYIKSVITIVIFILLSLPFIRCIQTASYQGNLSGVLEIPAPTQRGIKEGKPLGFPVILYPFDMADNIATAPSHFSSLFTQGLADYLNKTKMFESVRLSNVKASQKDIVLTGTITELKVMVTQTSVMGNDKYEGLATFSVQIVLQNKEGQKAEFNVTKTQTFSKRWFGETLSNVVADALEEIITSLRQRETEIVALWEKGRESLPFEERVQNDPRALKIKNLYDNGLITKSEYEQMLKKTLGNLSPSSPASVSQGKYPPTILILNRERLDNLETNAESIEIQGAVVGEREIKKVEFYLNNKLISTDEDRGISVVERPPKVKIADKRKLNFTQEFLLTPGKNEIKLVAYDEELSSSEAITIIRRVGQGQIWAAIIGISDYKNDNIRDLKYCTKDAESFKEYLIDNLNVPETHIYELLNDKATNNEIRSTLGTTLKNQAGKNDTVIIFFAGHGATESDQSNPDGDGLEKYLLPYNADLKDLYSTAIPMDEIRKIFQRIVSDRIIFMVDSCYSGASGGRTLLASGTRASISDGFLDRVSQGRGRVIITASNANEVAKEDEKLEHGVFTYYLLEGLRGSADEDRDGIITVDEVYSYLCDNVPKSTGQSQHPVKKGEVEGQIIIGKTKEKK